MTASVTSTLSATRTPTPSHTASPSLTQSFTASQTFTQTPQLSPTPTTGAISVTLRIFDASGKLLRQVSGGTASSAVGSLGLSSNPWDPTGGPLLVSDGAWSGSYDGRDSLGSFLASGNYWIEVESLGSGAALKSSKHFTVLRTVSDLGSALAWPNPVGKGVTFVSIAWAPATQEVDVQVYNQSGELVLDLGRLSGGKGIWELKNSASGVYFLAIRIPGERRPRLIKLALAR